MAAEIDATIEINTRAAFALPYIQELAREYIQLSTDQARAARALSWAMLEGNVTQENKHKARLQQLLAVEEELQERIVLACPMK